MKINININIEKRHFYFLVALVCAVLFVGVYAYNSGGPPSTMGHSDEEISNISAGKIKAGTFGSSVGGGSYTFPAYLSVANDITTSNLGASGNVVANLLHSNGLRINNGGAICFGNNCRANWWPTSVGVDPNNCYPITAGLCYAGGVLVSYQAGCNIFGCTQSGICCLLILS